jgi:DNA-binding HxlR family transcriptional regulator
MKGDVMRKSTVEIPGSSGIDTSYAQTASRAAAVLFQGKWRVEILCAMRLGPVRVGQLSRMIPRASKKMLAQNLRRLEADGLIVRHDMSEMILHVEYEFTNEAREEVCSLLDHLSQWGRIYALSRATRHHGLTRKEATTIEQNVH